MNLKQIETVLPAARFARLTKVVAELEAAIAAGIVPNVLHKDSKDILNRLAEEAATAFLATGPQRADGHDMSVWWHDAYRFDALISGLHGVPAALKRLQRAVNTDVSAYSAFLTGALLPLRTLLETAKPLIRKRGELPRIKTAKQLADEADQMTCQCCGRGIFAATGTIAHHGYQRPGNGYQTASCFGAKALPFEVSRERLGQMITSLKHQQREMIEQRARVEAEAAPVSHSWVSYDRGEREEHRATFTRATFGAVTFKTNGRDFDAFKRADIARRTANINSHTDYITDSEARFAGWKQTHKRAGGKWVAI